MQKGGGGNMVTSMFPPPELTSRNGALVSQRVYLLLGRGGSGYVKGKVGSNRVKYWEYTGLAVGMNDSLGRAMQPKPYTLK